MEQAQHLLIGTDLSIAEIAQAVGYDRSDKFFKAIPTDNRIVTKRIQKFDNKKNERQVYSDVHS